MNGRPAGLKTASDKLNGSPAGLKTASGKLNGSPARRKTAGDKLNGSPAGLKTAIILGGHLAIMVDMVLLLSYWRVLLVPPLFEKPKMALKGSIPSLKIELVPGNKL